MRRKEKSALYNILILMASGKQLILKITICQLWCSRVDQPPGIKGSILC